MRLPVLLVLVSSLCLAAERPKLAVLVIIDQLGEATFEQRAPQATGGIKRMLAEGLVIKHMRYETAPTLTSVGHATLATGAYPNTHGIVANEWFDEALGHATHSTEDARYQTLIRPAQPRDCTSPWALRVPTIGDGFKASRKEAKVVAVSGKERSSILPGGFAGDAVVWVDPDTGLFTTSTYYSRELPTWLGPINETLRKTIVDGKAPLTPGYTAKNAPPPTPRSEDGGFEGPTSERFEWQPMFEHAEVDAALAAVKALQLGKDDAPDFLSVSFSGHDFLAHQFGPDSQALEDDFRSIDFQLGRLLDGLDKEVGKGKYVVALTADHGGSQIPELLKERRLDAGRLDARKAMKAAMEAEADTALGAADWIGGWWTPGFYATPAGKAKLHQADAKMIAAGKKFDGVFEIMPLPALLTPGTFGALGDLYRHGAVAGRSPDLIVVVRPNWLASEHDRAAHGSPWLYDREVPLVFFGGGVKKGELPSAEAVDVAPTLAALVGAPPPAASVGHALLK